MRSSKFLYILCEGERDEVFYEGLAERITGLSFTKPADFRLRRGSNWKTAIAAAILLLNRFRNWNDPQEIAVIIAVDNDRAPGHPGSEPSPRPLPSPDQKKAPRHPDLVRKVAEALGQDRGKWPVEVALAVPVEMIESWLIPLLDSKCAELPLFSEAAQPLTRLYYGKRPPSQLKDIRKELGATLGLTADELFLKAAAEGDLHALAERSASFRMFREELLSWRKPENLN